MEHATVLLIDDSPVIRKRLIAMLTEHGGVEVVGEAEDGRTGLELAQKLSPAVVILDIRMPGMSGMELIQEIKRLEPPPIVVVLTNYPYAAYRRRCMELGADFFFDKSTEFDKITEVLG